MGTKHSLTILKSKHAFVDHLPPRSPCSCCLQTKKALSHPLRGASLRSAPHSSRNEHHVFALCEHCLPCFYLAWLKMCPRELSQKHPQKPKRAPREVPPEVPRGAPLCVSLEVSNDVHPWPPKWPKMATQSDPKLTPKVTQTGPQKWPKMDTKSYQKDDLFWDP